MPLTRVDLDTLVAGGCPCCGDPYTAESPMDFTAKCHPAASSLASYWDGVVTVRCNECGKVIAKIAVENPMNHATKTRKR